MVALIGVLVLIAIIGVIFWIIEHGWAIWRIISLIFGIFIMLFFVILILLV